MIEESDFETYLSISQSEYKIYLLDTKNLKCLYKNKIKIEENKNKKDLSNLSNFLENNIFKVEKLIGKFINRIILILDSDEIINISIGFKKKNYKGKIDKKILENLLIDAKDLFSENYQDNKIMHIIIERFLVNGNYLTSFENNIEAEYLCLEVQFRSISKIVVSKIDEVLKKYQIEITKCIDGNYVTNFLKNDTMDFEEKVFKMKNGFNQNEVEIVPKNTGKSGFFEKFFQLFS